MGKNIVLRNVKPNMSPPGTDAGVVECLLGKSEGLSFDLQDM
jgi:hypothetical protein